ncbi:MAG: polysaccharide biosynthesis protein [Lachnospiraceae bacterium]|jgi:stage V sporulation protein B|nr:polysaccharide biosynthesis protein [Lachnospiraceae bacterium]
MNKNNKRDNKSNIIAQAGVLATAGILSRLIGLLYKSPLNSIIGEEGMGYFYIANNYYTLVLLISSYSIPSAISKVIAQKLAAKEYRNAQRFFQAALCYALVAGGVGAAVLFFGANFFADASSAPVLRIFAPTVLLSGILGVIRGYFQAHNSMLQTSISQILEQIVNAAVSILAAVLVIHAFLGTLQWSDVASTNTAHSMYGAIGSAIGTGMGVLFSLIFICVIYGVNQPMFRKRLERDRSQQLDSYKSIFISILCVVTPFILSTAVYQLSSPVNLSFFRASSLFHASKEAMINTDAIIATNYGVFQNATMISNIPIAFASAMAVTIIPSITQYVYKKDENSIKNRLFVASKTTMIITIPCAVGLLVLANPIYGFLFRNTDEQVLQMGSTLLGALAVTVIFYGLSTLTNSCLQALGKVTAPILHALVALFCQTVVLVALLWLTDLGIYSLVIANIVYSLLMCIFNQVAIWRAVRYRQRFVSIFLKPLFSAFFLGAMAWATYQAFLLAFGNRDVALLIAVLIGAFCYFVMLLLVRGMNEQELRGLPKGYLLVKAAKRLHLLP